MKNHTRQFDTKGVQWVEGIVCGEEPKEHYEILWVQREPYTLWKIKAAGVFWTARKKSSNKCTKVVPSNRSAHRTKSKERKKASSRQEGGNQFER